MNLQASTYNRGEWQAVCPVLRPGPTVGAGCQTALSRERHPKPRPAAGAYFRIRKTAIARQKPKANVTFGRLRQAAMRLSCISWLLCLAPGDAAGTAASAIQVTHQARSLQPGEVVLLKAQSREPLRQLTASAFGRSFPLFTDEKNLVWTGLIGIDLETKPGRHTVKLRGTDANGGTVLAEDTYTVTGKTFPTRQLTVDEKFVNPPQQALARIREESARVRAVFDTVTPRRYWSGSFRFPGP
jgi:hypothetical protein